MESERFQQVLGTFFRNDRAAILDGPDVDGLLALDPAEQEAAEEILLNALNPFDSRPATGLGALRSRRAAPLVEMLMQDARGAVAGVRGMFLLNVSIAHWQLERSPEAFENIRRVLMGSQVPSIRAQAAQALEGIRERGSVHALSEALMDEDASVRRTAAQSLLCMHGITRRDDPLHPATARLSRAADSRARADAAREVRNLIDKAALVPE